MVMSPSALRDITMGPFLGKSIVCVSFGLCAVAVGPSDEITAVCRNTQTPGWQ